MRERNSEHVNLKTSSYTSSLRSACEPLKSLPHISGRIIKRGRHCAGAEVSVSCHFHIGDIPGSRRAQRQVTWKRIESRCHSPCRVCSMLVTAVISESACASSSAFPVRVIEFISDPGADTARLTSPFVRQKFFVVVGEAGLLSGLRQSFYRNYRRIFVEILPRFLWLYGRLYFNCDRIYLKKLRS